MSVQISFYVCAGIGLLCVLNVFLARSRFCVACLETAFVCVRLYVISHVIRYACTCMSVWYACMSVYITVRALVFVWHWVLRPSRHQCPLDVFQYPGLFTNVCLDVHLSRFASTTKCLFPLVRTDIILCFGLGLLWMSGTGKQVHKVCWQEESVWKTAESTSRDWCSWWTKTM